jgi:hypothetical protein
MGFDDETIGSAKNAKQERQIGTGLRAYVLVPSLSFELLILRPLRAFAANISL